MCIICVDFQQQRMTVTDARRALREMASNLEDGHAEEVESLIKAAVRDGSARVEPSLAEESEP